MKKWVHNTRRMVGPTAVFLAAFLLWSSNGAVGPCLLSETGCGLPTQHIGTTSAGGGSGRKRIVKGTPTTTKFFPWTVMVRRAGESTVKCGGAILCHGIVLTAAHCFDDGTTPFELVIYAGKDEMDYYNLNQDTRYVDTIVIHPNYSRTTMANDIALLKMEVPFAYSSNVRPICLPHAGEALPAGQLCYFAGYGDTLGIGFARRLNYILIPLINDTVCAQSDWLGEEYEALRSVSFCAGHPNGGPDGCTGDSGGPLVCQRDGEDGFFAYGISSWGRGCGERHLPGVYTRVSRYVDWINAQAHTLLLG